MQSRHLCALAQKSNWHEFTKLLAELKVEETADQVLVFLENNSRTYGYKGQIVKNAPKNVTSTYDNVGNAHNNALQNITYVTNNYYYINIVVNIHYTQSAMANIRECQDPNELYSYLEQQGKENLTNKVIKDLNLFDGQMLKDGAMLVAKGAVKTVNVFVAVFWTLVTMGGYVLYHALASTAQTIAQPVAKQIGYSTEPVNKSELKALPAPFQQKIENNEIIDVEIV